MEIYHFHGNHHLGDTMFAFIILYNIKSYLEQKNITVYFYMRIENINQMKDFCPINNMKIFDISLKPNNSFELWDCNDYDFEPFNLQRAGLPLNEYYVKYFNKRLKDINIPITLKDFVYEDEDLLYRYDKLDNKYKNIDILFINSSPLSKQFIYNESYWNYGIKKLSSKYKIVTTKKINGVLSTLDDNLKIKDIAALSINTKVVIAINTGPITGLLNTYTLKNVKKFYIFCDNAYYSYNNFENKKKLSDITIEELDRYIC